MSLVIISAVTILPLIYLLIKEKPDIFISHLNTMFTMILSNFFNTKFIVRISGYPRLHFLENFWKISRIKFMQLFVQLNQQKNYYLKKIFKEDKIHMVEDPIFSLDDIEKTKNNFTNNILAIGRLTKQKNFSFLISFFKIIENKYPNKYNLNILGEGEERNNLEKLIDKLDLKNKVNLVGYKNNIKTYFRDSFCFILSSLWEDPGFVLIESAINRTFILSSDCPNGPKEFLEDNKGGILFKSNDKEDFIKNFDLMLSLDDFNKKIISYSVEKTRAYSLKIITTKYFQL